MKGHSNSSLPPRNNSGFAQNNVQAVEHSTNNCSWRVRTLCLVDLIKRCEAHRRGADSGAAKTAPCIAVAGATGFCAGNGRYARYVITIKRQFMILTRRRGWDRIGRTVRCGAAGASREINLNFGSLTPAEGRVLSHCWNRYNSQFFNLSVRETQLEVLLYIWRNQAT